MAIWELNSGMVLGSSDVVNLGSRRDFQGREKELITCLRVLGIFSGQDFKIFVHPVFTNGLKKTAS